MNQEIKSGLLYTANMWADVSVVTQLSVVHSDSSEGAGDVCSRWGFIVMLDLLVPYIVQDFPEHLEQTQQMEFNAPTNPRHLIMGSQATIHR